VSRDTSAYRQVAVESYLAGSVVRIRPLGGQAYAPTLSVQCARRLCDTDVYPLGTRFLLLAKMTDRLGGRPFLYAYHGDPDVRLSARAAKAFLAQWRRGRI
jgi:hypothetical protein